MAVKHVSSPEYWAVIEQAAETDPGHSNRPLIQHPLPPWNKRRVAYGSANMSHARHWDEDLKTITCTKNREKNNNHRW